MLSLPDYFDGEMCLGGGYRLSMAMVFIPVSPVQRRFCFIFSVVSKGKALGLFYLDTGEWQRQERDLFHSCLWWLKKSGCKKESLCIINRLVQMQQTVSLLSSA